MSFSNNHSSGSSFNYSRPLIFSRDHTPSNHEVESQHNTQFNKTLLKIIDRLQPSLDQQQKQQLVSKFSQIIASQSEAIPNQTEQDILNTIQNKIKDAKGSEEAFRFSRLYSKLSSRQRLNKKGSILQLLNQTSTINPERPLTPAIRPHETNAEESNRNNRRRRLEEIEGSDRPEPKDPPAIQLAKARERKSFEQRSRHAVVSIKEIDILKDLLYIFQGMNGHYIRYDDRIDDYTVLSSVEITKSTEDIIFKLAEIGWLFKKIRDFIEKEKDSNKMGLIGQSLCATIQDELKEYYKFITLLSSQFENQISELDRTNKTITLKRLLIWTLEYKDKLGLLKELSNACQDQKGGELVSIIHNYTKHGDPFIKEYMINILKKVSIPFYSILAKWVYEGELDDPYQEFFVICNTTLSQNNLWQSKYILNENMLPIFLSKDLANKIFSIGKSLNFIRYSCYENNFILQSYNGNTEQSFKYGETKVVEESIEIAYKETNKALIHLLQTKYKLSFHLKALKNYILLGQGDFIQSLMDSLWVDLNQPADLIHKHNLNDILQASIRTSNSQYEDPEILKRLSVRLLEVQNNEIGWDVFSLDYKVDTPINAVLNTNVMQQYLEIFHFLWRLKRVEYTLSLLWRQWGKSSKELVEIQYIQSIRLTIQHMVHFIYQLQCYMLFEVLECSWDKLEKFIENNSIDLDSIIEAHSNYLSEISKKGFINEHREKKLSTGLYSIFHCILKYSTLLNHLYNYVTTKKTRVLTTNDIKLMSKLRQQHNLLEDQFKIRVLDFLNILNSYQDEDLRSLSTRLDYNNFYISI